MKRKSVHFKIVKYKRMTIHNTHPDPLGTTLTPRLIRNNNKIIKKSTKYIISINHVNRTIAKKQKQNAIKKR